MKFTRTMVGALTVMLSALPLSAANTAAPYYSIRSASVNAAGELICWQQQINRCDMAEQNYASFSGLYQYSQSFNADNIVQTLFGDDVFFDESTVPNVCLADCPAQIKVSGSDVVNRDNDKDWLADYFGLPTDFESTLTFNPKVQTFADDWNLYMGFHSDMCKNLYFRIHAPLVWTRWRLNFSESDITAGVNPYVEGYFSDLAVPRDQLLANASAFLTGQEAPTILGSTGAPVTNPIGSPITFEKLLYGRFRTPQQDCGPCSQIVRLSDIEFTLGWNFACNEDYHVGLGIRASAPTGNRPTGQFLFEPMIGSGGSWKLGGQLTSHFIFWRSHDEHDMFGFWLDANIQHLFAAKQVRTFDIAGKPNSRYALAQKLGSQRLAVHLAGISDDGVEWQNEFAPIANLTASSVKVTARVEGNFVAKFAWINDHCEGDLGFEFWGRSCEKICPTRACESVLAQNPQSWALKGDAYVVGFENLAGSANPNVPVRLAATESHATIHKGLNVELSSPTLAAGTNPGIDDPKGATTNSVGNPIVRDIILDEPVNSSNPVVFLTQNDIGYANAATRGISYKIFANWSYAWEPNAKNVVPYVGVGAAGEFAQQNRGCGTGTQTVCNLGACQTAALEQWLVWLKAGVSFE